MGYTLEIPDELFSKLQRHAVPLIDTPLSVIERALRALEAGDEAPTSGPSSLRTFNPSAPPDLKFTSVLKAQINGKVLRKADTNWNAVLLHVINEAAAMKTSPQDILDLVTVNSQLGCREDSGFKFVEAAGISIQGQDANSAWRQAYTLASSLGIEIDLTFVWQSTDKAAMPSVTGTMFVPVN